jgi:hypothetical protein
MLLTEAQRTQLAAERDARAVPLTVEARVPVRLRFGKVLRTWTVDVRPGARWPSTGWTGTPR